MIIATGGEDDFDKDPLDSALRSLARVDIETHTVAVAILRFGWTGRRIAAFQGVSQRTVARRWLYARAFLRRELAGGDTT
jgi:DNA-directed RNA polymerase specialized sigma24 family protein